MVIILEPILAHLNNNHFIILKLSVQIDQSVSIMQKRKQVNLFDDLFFLRKTSKYYNNSLYTEAFSYNENQTFWFVFIEYLSSLT